MDPWPHQILARELLRSAVAEGHRRVICMAPCGAGKSFIAALMLEGTIQKGFSALILAPQIELVDQMAEKFRADYGIDCGVIMAGRPIEKEKPIQVASIQTLWSRAYKKKKMYRPPADVVIVDEAHLFSSELRQTVLDHYHDKPIIGLTATPIGPGGSGLGHAFSRIVQPTSYEELRKNGVLVPCEIFAPDRPDMDGVKVTAGDWNKRASANRMSPLIGDVYQHWERLAKGKCTLLFAASVAQSRWLCEESFQKNGVAAAHVDGKMDKKTERDPIYKKLRSGEITVLCTCNVLSEGTDIPELEVAINAAPTKSLRRWRQRMGRVLRACDGKEKAIIIDHAGSFYLHGYPDSDIEWELEDDGFKDKERKRQSKHEAQTIVCPACSAVRERGIECQNCGHKLVPKKVKKEVDQKKGKLSYVSPRDRSGVPLVLEQEEWNRCLAVAARKNGTFSMAFFLFHKKFGRWPDRSVARLPTARQKGMRVSVVYPGFLKRKRYMDDM